MGDLKASTPSSSSSKDILKITEWQTHSLDRDWENSRPLSPQTQEMGSVCGAEGQHKEIIRNAGSEFCARIFTEALLKTTEPAKRTVGLKLNNPKWEVVTQDGPLNRH